MQIQIIWLLKKPTDLDLHCLLKQGMSCSAKEGLNIAELKIRLLHFALISVILFQIEPGRLRETARLSYKVNSLYIEWHFVEVTFV